VSKILIHNDRTWHVRRADEILLPADMSSILDKCPTFVLYQAYVLKAGERKVCLLNDSSRNGAQEYATVIIESKTQISDNCFLWTGYQFESVTTS